jgi:hypothetical protein
MIGRKILALVIIYILYILCIILYKLILKESVHEIIYSHYYGTKYIEDRPESSYKVYNKPIVILVPVYNSDIKMLRSRIKYLMLECSHWKIYIYGLDSNKKTTLEDLHKWERECEHVKLVPLLKYVPPSRTKRIAAVRNALIDCVDLSTPSDTKVLMYDGDHRGPMSKNGLFVSFDELDKNDNWFAIASSGSMEIFPGYKLVYDKYAHVGIDGTNYFPERHWLLPLHTEVISAYNGASIYRWRELRDFRYPMKHDVCEHVSLHKLMRKKLGKTMMMSKKFEILVGHQPSVHKKEDIKR